MECTNAINDDHVVSKVLAALVNAATGNYQEAFLLFCDLEALYGEELEKFPSMAILNGKGCANLLAG